MMGHLSASAAVWRSPTGAWPRARRRRWVRPDDSVGACRLLAVIPSLPRAELSRLTTWMIDRMDEIDGDPDLEDPHDAEKEQCHE